MSAVDDILKRKSEQHAAFLMDHLASYTRQSDGSMTVRFNCPQAAQTQALVDEGEMWDGIEDAMHYMDNVRGRYAQALKSVAGDTGVQFVVPGVLIDSKTDEAQFVVSLTGIAATRFTMAEEAHLQAEAKNTQRSRSL